MPVADVAAGTPVNATAAGIATADGAGADVAACCAEAAGPVESAADVSPEVGCVVDVAASAPEVAGFARERGGASELALASALALASEGGRAVAFWLFESFLAGWPEAAPSRGLLCAGGDASLGRCAADCSCATVVARALLASAAVLLSTSAAKLSCPWNGSGADLAAFVGAP